MKASPTRKVWTLFWRIRATSAGPRMPDSVTTMRGCFGGCTAMIGVSQQDVAIRKACETKCKSDGFEQGKLGPSTERDPQKPNRHKFVACICSGGKDTLEFDSSKLKP